MHISCPHCKATYEIGTVIKNSVLVCYRCHTEFGVDETPGRVENETNTVDDQEQSLPLFIHAESLHTETEQPIVDPFIEQRKEPLVDIELTEFEEEQTIEELAEQQHQPEPVAEKQEAAEEHSTKEHSDIVEHVASAAENEPLPPARENVTIWPWLVVILLIIGGVGFWYKQDVWLENPWVRSTLINMHLPVEVRDRDWQIIPESVRGQWLTRDDQSPVLVIEGRIANRLYCELAPPQIQVHFFDDSGLDQVLGEVTLSITEPPSIEQVKHAPFEMPGIDRVPVGAQGERGFFLVLDSLPERTADFTLAPVVKKGKSGGY